MDDDKYIPIDEVAEANILAAILTSPDAFYDVFDIVSASDFGVSDYSEIFIAIMALEALGKPFDEITVAEQLKVHKQLTQVGGRSRLRMLSQQGVAVTNVVHHARIVADKAVQRRLLSTAREVAALATDASVSAQDSLETAEELIFKIGAAKDSDTVVPVRIAVGDALTEIKNASGKELLGVDTGFHDLNVMTGGFTGGQLIIVAARPGVGKSAFALQLARNMAETSGKVIPFVSYEMSVMELTMRLLSTGIGYDLNKLRRNDLPPAMGTLLAAEAEAVSNLNMLLDDRPPRTISGLRSSMRRLARRNELGAIVVDYLQLMSGEITRSGQNRAEEVGEISRGLKILASELDVPIVALAQLNRQVESRTNQRPQLSDIRDSGCLTGDSRVIDASSGQLVRIDEFPEAGSVFGLSDDQKINAERSVNAFSTGVKDVFEVTFVSGKKVKASPNHKFFTGSKWTRLDSLVSGDLVATPLFVPEPLNPVSMSEDELVLVAHLVGDSGVLSNRSLQYVTTDVCSRDAVMAASASFGTKPWFVFEKHFSQNRRFQVCFPADQHRSSLVTFFKKLGLYKKSFSAKFIPSPVFSVPNDQLALFVSHLWAADGHVSSSSVYYSTMSRRLADDVAHLLLRFGLHANVQTVSQVDKDKTPRLVYRVLIYGSAQIFRFVELFGMFGKIRNARSVVDGPLFSKADNLNVNAFPPQVSAIQKSAIKDKGRSLNFSGRFSVSQFDTQICRPTALPSVKSRAEFLELDELMARIPSDVFWDEVKTVDFIGSEEVFDLTVEGVHNYVAEGVIHHNSIEQDASLVAFLFREHMYNSAADPSTAELIIGKQRNGPTGIVHMAFDDFCVRFREKNSKPQVTRSSAKQDPFGEVGDLGWQSKDPF